MAAVLKKRVIAEFSQTIQEEPKPPQQKKLRLVHKVKVAESVLDLQNVHSSDDALQAVLKFEETLPTSASNAEHIIQSLTEHFYKEKEGHVRAKLISLIAELVKTPGFIPTFLVSEINNLLKDEKSHKVVSQLLHCLLVIGKTQPQDGKLHQQLIATATKYLKDSNHIVRCRCLDMIGALGSPDTAVSPESSQSEQSIETLLEMYITDDDPRVRTSAFQALLSWHQRGVKLQQNVYNKVCDALTDDYQGVRVTALKLIWVLCQLYPDSMVTVSEKEEIRLVDDGFAKICNMVNDVNMEVRAEAAGLLGSLHQVSPRFLEQTLDKKLMSNMRKKETAHDRQKQNFTSGVWSSGSKWADDAPKEEVDADSITIINSGACGAFVHGLEDEFMEVRNAAMDSLCELATQSASFAIQSQDFLVDMFNDEIESVRLNAVNSVRKISHHITVREDQLEIISAVLKDFNYEIRDAIREMFMCVKVATSSCLHSCVLALLDNLKRYPQDREPIWRCMQGLGKHHPHLTLPLVPELLSAHPYFDSPEPDMDDPAYISVLILVFNSAVSCPTMPPLFPEHTLRHYSYLRDTLPEMVPKLQIPGLIQGTSSSEKQKGFVNNFLHTTMKRLEGIDRLDRDAAQDLITVVIRDLERVSEVDSSLAATAECTALYLQCQHILAKLMSGSQWSSPALAATPETTRSTALIDKVMQISHQMEELFVGLGQRDQAAIRQVRLRAQTLQLLTKLRGSSAENKSACVQYLQTLNQLQRVMQTNQLTADSFTQALLQEMPRLESCEPHIYLNVLQSVLHQHKPTGLQLSNQVQRVRAKVIEPTGMSDNAIKFTAGLTTAVTLVAKIDNLEQSQNIRIQIRYPDQTVQWVVPKSGCLKQLSPLHHRLVTQVLLTHQVWSDSCSVELCIVQCFNPDKDKHGKKAEVSRIEANANNVLELCKPVKVLISPKPSKKL